MVESECCRVSATADAEGGVARRVHNLPPENGGINSGCRFKLNAFCEVPMLLIGILFIPSFSDGTPATKNGNAPLSRRSLSGLVGR